MNSRVQEWPDAELAGPGNPAFRHYFFAVRHEYFSLPGVAPIFVSLFE